MKKVALVFGLLLIASTFLVLIFWTVKGKVQKDLFVVPPSAQSPKVTISTVAKDEVVTSLFVPYWTMTSLSEDFSEFDSLIYFGITPTIDGINQEEQGYKLLPRFLQNANGKEIYLMLRMLDNTTNLAILKDAKAQEAIISQTFSIAKEYKFSGIILDLELSALPFDSLLKQINGFVSKLAKQASNEDVTFSLTMYGDTFYRVRPFDVGELSQYVDTIYIMAYDFHKAGGINPGPNFPLRGRSIYGYDLEAMIDDFLEIAPAEKLNVVFGMFGYDWIVNENGNALQLGDPLSYNKIKQEFLTTCSFKRCANKRDDISSEVRVTYADVRGRNHVVWFEDMESVKRKQELLRTKGIGSYSFWAYSYY